MKNTPSRLWHQGVTGSALGTIRLAGLIRNGPGIPADQLRSYPSYAVVYSLGSGEYRDARHTAVRLRPGHVVLVFPELPHRYGPGPHDRWDEIYITFDGPVFDLWRRAGLLDPARPVLYRPPVAYWQRRFEEVAAPDRTPLERACRLQLLLAELLEAGPAHDDDESWLRRARALLAAAPGRELYVDEVARSLGQSPETFRKKFARLAGQSPWQFRQERVMDEACRLVVTSQATNKEIARQLGFSDEFHFSRRFKQVTGLSPSQFRALVPRSR